MDDVQIATLVKEMFALSCNIRYVAIYQPNQLITRQRPTIENASASESDRYEELLVNPTLLLLARQRGDIDCGGLEFLVVAYGNFFQYVRPFLNGHLSVCIAKEANPFAEAKEIEKLLADGKIE